MSEFTDHPEIEGSIIVSGRLSSGKDYFSKAKGLTIVGFADVMYQIAEERLGTSDKSVPGVRRYLQKIGAWGRGVYSPEYPVTAARRREEAYITAHGHRMTDLNDPAIWDTFGRPKFWIDVLDARIEQNDFGDVAITNGRFPNELNHFYEDSFQHFHVACTEETRKERLEEKGETYDPEAENDTTEQMAAELDQIALSDHIHDPEYIEDIHPSIVFDVLKQRTLIWNDHRPIPSN